MKQKTAMMELIDWVELRFNNPRETEIFKKATQLLEKEKEQMYDFFMDGYDKGMNWHLNKEDADSQVDRIYNETYKQD